MPRLGLLPGLAGRLYGLVIRLADRLPPDQVEWLRHVVEVDEYGLALEDMAAMLVDSMIAITDEERDDMLALASRMNMKDLDLKSAWPRRRFVMSVLPRTTSS